MRLLVGLCPLLLLGTLLPSAAQAARVTVELPPLDCPALPEIAEQLVHHCEAELLSRPDGILTIRGEARRLLYLSLQRNPDELPIERRVTVKPEDCPELADATAHLVARWAALDREEPPPAPRKIALPSPPTDADHLAVSLSGGVSVTPHGTVAPAEILALDWSALPWGGVLLTGRFAGNYRAGSDPFDLLSGALLLRGTLGLAPPLHLDLMAGPAFDRVVFSGDSLSQTRFGWDASLRARLRLLPGLEVALQSGLSHRPGSAETLRFDTLAGLAIKIF